MLYAYLAIYMASSIIEKSIFRTISTPTEATAAIPIGIKVNIAFLFFVENIYTISNDKNMNRIMRLGDKENAASSFSKNVLYIPVAASRNGLIIIISQNNFSTNALYFFICPPKDMLLRIYHTRTTE